MKTDNTTYETQQYPLKTDNMTYETQQYPLKDRQHDI